MSDRILQFAVAVGLLCAVSFAHAQTVFNVKGAITAGTCALRIDDKDLGSYSASLFTGSFQSGLQDIPVNVTGCAPGITSVTLKVDGSASVSNSNYFAAKPGVGVDLRVKSPSPRNLAPGTSFSVASADFSKLTFQAQFIQVAALNEYSIGDVMTPVTVTATFQ